MKGVRRQFDSWLLASIILVFFIAQQIMASTPLLTKITAKRLDDGSIIITGIAKLPVGTKLMVDLRQSQKLIGQASCSVLNGGYFEAGRFTNGEKSWPIGSYKVCIVSHFTKIFGQSQQVLTQVGEKGINLPNDTLIPDDPEFPKSGGHLEIIATVSFPPISADVLAIQSVQESKLNVVGKGRSTSSVKEVVAYFQKAGGFTPLSWTAKQDGKGSLIVTLDCIDGGKQKKVQWSFNPKTREVKYLDPLAKLLSWLPEE